MRSVHALFCLVLILFAAVQYNDPDFYFWVPVYLVPAAWSALAVFRPGRLRGAGARVALWLSIALAVAGTWWLWPTDHGFWHQEVWWNSETAREGMGMMIVVLALVMVAVSARPPAHSR